MAGRPDGEVYIREEQLEDLARRVANKVVSLLATHAERIAGEPPSEGVSGEIGDGTAALGGGGDPNAPPPPAPNPED